MAPYVVESPRFVSGEIEVSTSCITNVGEESLGG
jgi:hypothetical protein